MNHEYLDLTGAQPLQVDQHLLKDVLECLTHTILFHRALGFVKPKEVSPGDSSKFEMLSYVKCDDLEMEHAVSEKVKTACETLKKIEGVGQVNLQFFSMPTVGMLGFKKGGSVWEEWAISIDVRNEPAFGSEEEKARKREMELELQKIIWNCVNFVNQKRAHLPPIHGGSQQRHRVDCFPYELVARDPHKKESGSFFSLWR
eukprot:CAMPEP_0114556294 /NCGR_PEP_ID=MMETSP0114-20121206/9218_1 /TAXON_ID=31324 /ORGANISM="Goniomonas sp, Strain m" /LENGTH=200 /DNA_ID=CAMNT_0001741501 /DNA_START=53 /DNA_END=651 /DNA_ORIENTATION=+